MNATEAKQLTKRYIEEAESGGRDLAESNLNKYMDNVYKQMDAVARDGKTEMLLKVTSLLDETLTNKRVVNGFFNVIKEELKKQGFVVNHIKASSITNVCTPGIICGPDSVFVSWE